MSVYLGDLNSYDPVEFGLDVQSLIMESLEKVALKDLFDSESSFYENLIQEIKDVLHEFCDEVADEAYERGEADGHEYSYDQGYESGYESASEDMYTQDYVDDLEETISDLRSEVSNNEELISELENNIEEARQPSVEIDLDEIRQAVKADLLAEMTLDDSDYED
jgi:flagellar biosynthesis/type III secretory pathway protein FliH